MHTPIHHAEFPATGQRIRVLLIDGEPWFVTMDVCRILGRRNASDAVKNLHSDETRTVDMRTVCLAPNEAYGETAGRNAYGRGNQTLNLVNESGLFRLVIRCDKATARPFQDWVTRELLPSIRRGDADLGGVRERMAETLTEALDLGDVPPIPPPVPEPEPVATFELLGQTFRLYPDGSVHCPHGGMDPVFPTPDEDDGPPYGPRFRCARVERVGIFGSKAFRPCPPVRLTDLVRATCPTATAPEPAPMSLPRERSVLVFGIAGEPADVLTVLNGVRTPA